mgnify:CR=1 FL=1
MPTKPNIIYIHSHDTGRYIQPYGHAISTPNIQNLAEGGVLFRQAFCANPTCSPSRACLLTGRWAHSCDMTGLVNRGWSLPEPEHLITYTLKNAGYTTTLAGFQHVVKNATDGGWERILSQESDEPNAEKRAAAFLAEDHDGPFFLDVGFGETHRRGRGFAPQPGNEPQTDPRYVRPAAPYLDTPETRQDMAEYIDAARTLDRKMGVVFNALKEHDLADNTLVICTTDHGIAFPNMKCHLTDHGTGVMLILRGPKFRGGKVLDALVSHVDLFPTVCEFSGIDPPDWLQGTSLIPLVGPEGGTDSVRNEIYAEVNYHCCYTPQRMVRTERWKYIRRFDERRTPAAPNCDESLTKDYWLNQGWRDQEMAEERLYDLVFDPNETCNLAGDKKYSDTLKDMRARLNRWLAETDDPILTGPMIPHPEAMVNNPEGRSPKEQHYPARKYLGF